MNTPPLEGVVLDQNGRELTGTPHPKSPFETVDFSGWNSTRTHRSNFQIKTFRLGPSALIFAPLVLLAGLALATLGALLAIPLLVLFGVLRLFLPSRKY